MAMASTFKYNCALGGEQGGAEQPEKIQETWLSCGANSNLGTSEHPLQKEDEVVKLCIPDH